MKNIRNEENDFKKGRQKFLVDEMGKIQIIFRGMTKKKVVGNFLIGNEKFSVKAIYKFWRSEIIFHSVQL